MKNLSKHIHYNTTEGLYTSVFTTFELFILRLWAIRLDGILNRHLMYFHALSYSEFQHTNTTLIHMSASRIIIVNTMERRRSLGQLNERELDGLLTDTGDHDHAEAWFI